jgi:hypothetical protein
MKLSDNALDCGMIALQHVENVTEWIWRHHSLIALSFLTWQLIHSLFNDSPLPTPSRRCNSKLRLPGSVWQFVRNRKRNCLLGTLALDASWFQATNFAAGGRKTVAIGWPKTKKRTGDFEFIFGLSPNSFTIAYFKIYLSPIYLLSYYPNKLTISKDLSHSSEAAHLSAIQEFRNILRKQKVHYRAHKSPPLESTLSQKNSVYTTPSCL